MGKAVTSFSRVAALVLLAALGTPSASSQGQGNAPALSPNGKFLAIARRVDGKENIKSWALDLVDTDCLLRLNTVPSCTRTIGEDLFLPSTLNYSIQWSRDSKTLIAAHQVFRVFAQDGATTRFRVAGQIEPRVFEPDFLHTDPRRLYEPIDLDSFKRVIVNGRSQIVGQILNRFPEPSIVADMWGHEIALPSLLTRMEIRSLASEPGFYLWAGEVAERGLLAEFKPEGLKAIEVPADLHGPARVAWDSSGGGPAAFHDPFRIYPLPHHRAGIEWLEQRVDAMRADDPSAELLSVSVSTDGGIAYLEILKGLACNETLVVTKGAMRSISEECAESSNDRLPAIMPVTIPATQFDLKGQIYAWQPSSTQDSRGILIYFHGGPRRDVMSDRSYLPARALSDRFDLVMIDYRGSTGRGEVYAEALKQPVADIVAEDLQSVVAWAKGQQRYRDQATGFWGTSWGGLAGYAALSRGIKGHDFIIIDNGFIENPPAARTTVCAMEGHWKTGLFGFSTRQDGSCLLNEAGVIGRPINAAVPILLLYGESDLFVTPIDLARDWVADAEHQKACVSVATSKVGGHSMLAWPTAAVDGAVQIVQNWVEDVKRGSRKACGRRVTLP